MVKLQKRCYPMGTSKFFLVQSSMIVTCLVTAILCETLQDKIIIVDGCELTDSMFWSLGLRCKVI